jgi:hypothetical protein
MAKVAPRVIFRVEPEYARKRKRDAGGAAGVLLPKFRSAADRAKDVEVERAWLEASAGMQRTVARVERAVRFRQFPPLTRAYVDEFPQEAGRIRELRGEYNKESRVGWAGRELYREELLRAASAVACART